MILTCSLKRSLTSPLPNLTLFFCFLFQVSTLKFHATVGQRLLNIKYRDEGTQTAPTNNKLMMFVITIVGSHWIKARENHIAVWLQRWPTVQYVVRIKFH